MKILIVDLERFLAELVKLALEADGHVCYTAATADMASEILIVEEVDLVTLGLDANDRGALDWLERVVLAHPEFHGRVFVLADRPLDREESSRALACGARVIGKPFTLDQVRETVDMMTPLKGRGRESSFRERTLEV
jgi:DNA-binding response OmpR family regulator